MSLIINNLYLGSKSDAFSTEFTNASILNCAKEVPKSPYCKDYLHLPLDDVYEEQLSPYFTIANEFIENQLQKGNKVLVHCHAGISRSATIVIMYLMVKYKLTLEKAYKYVKSRRSIVRPNSGFYAELLRLDKFLNN